MTAVAEAPRGAAAARGRVRRTLARVPRELALLLVVVAAFGCAWAVFNPPWQSPDEDVHFSYTQTLVERHAFPQVGHSLRRNVSSEQEHAQAAMNNDPVVTGTYATPEWSRAAFEAWKNGPPESRSNGGGSNFAASYPPAYYVAEMLPYFAARSGSIFSRLYAMRLMSVVWLLVTTTMSWLVAGEVFGRRRRMQLVVAAFVGLWPMLTFMSSSVNPDALFYAESATLLWLGAAILRRGMTWRRALAFGATLGLAMVTKATALAFLPAALFALGWPLVRAWRSGLVRPRALAAGLAVVAFALPVGAWYAKVHAGGGPAYEQAGLVTGGSSSGGQVSIKGYVNYVWQYYLPRLGFMTPRHYVNPVISHYPAYNGWIGTGWAAFGWVTIWFPPWVYAIFLALTVALAAAAAWTARPALRRGRFVRALRGLDPMWLFFALMGGVLLAGVHWSEFTLRYAFIQGRYLFPVAVLFALVAAQATMAAPRRWRPPLTGLLLGGLVAFQLCSLWLVTTRFYA